MKGKWLYIVTLFLFGIFAFPSLEAKANTTYTGAKLCITVRSSVPASQKQNTGDSPFIRFHHGIGESNVSIASYSQSIIPLKPVNSIPEKFAGIMEYISSADYTLPVTRVFFYSLPLRSPPLFS